MLCKDMLFKSIINETHSSAHGSASPFRDDQAERMYLKANVNYKLEGDEEPGV